MKCKICEINEVKYGVYCSGCLDEEFDSQDESDIQAAVDKFDELIEEQKNEKKS